MESKLDQLARELQVCRRKGNRKTLESVLESAQILGKAKEITGRGFGTWLREKGHMEYGTARRHLEVERFVKANSVLTTKIATLSIAKLYAISALNSDTARRLLGGEIPFSAPLEHLSDVAFRKEFREHFPPRKKRSTRAHVYRALSADVGRLERGMQAADRLKVKLKPLQRARLAERILKLARMVSEWRMAV